MSEVASPRAAGLQHIASWKWALVWLMFLATMINYMDRQTMQATSSHLIRDFFNNKEAGYGQVESSFNIAFAISLFLSGFLVDRYSVRWLYVGALLVWSAAGLCTGLVHTIELLILCRVVLGFAEGFNWPCAVTVVKRALPLEARSLANSIFHSGASIGAATTPLLALLMIDRLGLNWRTLFVVVGALGGFWAVLWFIVVRGERLREIDHDVAASENQTDTVAPAQTFLQVLCGKLFLITLTASITVNICWHFFRIWLPRILRKDLQFSENDMLWMLAGFFIAADVGCLLSGFATHRLTRAGLSVARSRKVVSTAAAALCLLAVPLAFQPPPLLTVVLVLIVAAGAMGGFANMFALSQETSTHHTAKVSGLVGAVPWVGLAVLNPIIGSAADESGTFAPAIIAVAVLPLGGGTGGVVVAGEMILRQKQLSRGTELRPEGAVPSAQAEGLGMGDPNDISPCKGGSTWSIPW